MFGNPSVVFRGDPKVACDNLHLAASTSLFVYKVWLHAFLYPIRVDDGL